MKNNTALSLVCILAFLTGCKVGPDYTPPAASTPDNWVSTSSDAKAEIEQDWWKHFHDPVLDQLIARASAGNWDLKIAETRIAQARAARATALNTLLPTGDVKGGYERQANQIAFPGKAPFDLAKPFDIYQTGFDASWELDLFGGNKRALEAATADLKATEATRDDARVSLLAEVARAYVDIRQYQTQLAITRDNITAQDKTAKIAKERFKVGDTAELDVAQAEAQVKAAKAELPYYQNLLLQAEYSMDVLLGEKPGATVAMITDEQPIPVGNKALVLAAPAKVIADRPDIREAERKLASATASQGVAVAQFFPNVSLSGFLGLFDSQAGDLLRTSSKSWVTSASVLWPILSYGKLSANLHAADARQQEALAQYQKSIIAALSDVERSVTAYTKEEDHRAALEESAKYNEHVVKIANERYKEGLSSFIEVLDAERSLFSSQSQEAASRALASQNLIAVYKSLGGGWKAAAVSDAKTPAPEPMADTKTPQGAIKQP